MESIGRPKSSYFPKCWDDDVRMNFLMQEFRPKDINPCGYEDKMSFWINTIQDWSNTTKTVSFTHEDACRAFDRKKRQPECLHTVMDEMRKQKTLVTMEEFLSVGKGWVNWTFDLLVKKPLGWGWSTALNMMNWQRQPQRYVNIVVLKEIALDIVTYHHERVSCEWTDNIVILEDLYKECKDICGNRQTFQLVLRQLEREKQIQIFEVDTRKVVKFRRKDEPTVSTASEIDVELQRLQYAKDILDSEIVKLDRAMESLKTEAKQVLAKGQKNKAGLLLKKKKRLEAVLEKKLAACDNLENLFNSLHQSKTQKAVLQAYQSSVSALNRLHTEEGLTVDSADTTMAEVEEVLEDQVEIQNAISQPVGFDVDTRVNDSDLELELEEILQEEKTTRRQQTTSTDGTQDQLSKLEFWKEEPSRPSTSHNRHTMEYSAAI